MQPLQCVVLALATTMHEFNSRIVGPTPTNTPTKHKVKVYPLPRSHPMVHSRNHVSNSTKHKVKVYPLPRSHPMVHSRNHVSTQQNHKGLRWIHSRNHTPWSTPATMY
ncbi:hypothetical protein QL285_068615 [Trifolium repens]|nr:hypothetical protein QL285_068615 [Trifolium repens]